MPNHITKNFRFEAAHILDLPYASKCKNLHGHSYQVIVELQKEILDASGMVYDYVPMKTILESHIGEMDHKLLLPQRFIDEDTNDEIIFTVNGITRIVHPDEVYILPGVHNTTAEELAQYLFTRMYNSPLGDCLHSITVCETATTSARYQL